MTEQKTHVFESGMYKGYDIRDVPGSYLYFLVNRVGESKVGKIAREFLNEDRKKQGLKLIP